MQLRNSLIKVKFLLFYSTFNLIFSRYCVKYTQYFRDPVAVTGKYREDAFNTIFNNLY